jgi:hypothetical protein
MSWLEVAEAQSASGNWDPQFTVPSGLNGPVYAMVSQGNSLYVGGAFSKAGAIGAYGVARWDGTNWSSLGAGVSGSVFALAISGTDLFVGGRFHTAGDIGATNIAKWNGATWEALGGGVDQGGFYSNVGVQALYASGSNLFVGGQFLTAGGLPAINVARWDGSAWHAMDFGVFLPDDPEPQGSVQAITGDGTNVYVGGLFIQAGSIAATNIARWDGNTWQAMGDCTGGTATIIYQGNPLSGNVSALTMQQRALFAGGSFGFAGGVPAQDIARWDGTNWENIGDVTGGSITALESYSGSLYLAGDFTNAGGVATTNAAIWTSGTWSALNADLHPVEYANTVHHFGSRLYLGGYFSWLNGVSAGNLADWNGTNWLALRTGTGNSLGGLVSALATGGSEVYAAGYFGTAGTNTVSGLAKWDGTNWSAVGLLPPADGWLLGNSVAVVGSNIFVGGTFTIPEAGATNLAYWDGTKWNSPGGALTNVFISQLLSVENIVYAAGSFSDVSGNTFGPVAAWNGTNWSNVVGASLFDEDCLATDGTNLYIAENTYSPMIEDYLLQLARWDGTNLLSLGDGFPYLRASALAVSGANLFLGVSVTTNNYSAELCSWNGTGLQTLATPTNGYIGALLALRGNLYVSGTFSSIGGTAANSIAEWDGINWLSLSNGLTFSLNEGNLGYVTTMVSVGRKIFAGGQFEIAGSLDSGNFAVWNEAPEIRLRNLRTNLSNGFTFDLSGISGDELEVQTSVSLTNWMSLGTVTLGSDTQAFSDSPVTNANHRFYRARFIK